MAPRIETISQPEATPSNTPASLVLLASPSTLDAPSTTSAIPTMTPAPRQGDLDLHGVTG